ncbi:hypothetical protein F3Y22_tig00000340pilonHSYRG01241 [Hibiscus syriacus]|uniref:Uncharacterized protein n=1 Tax=Hibiscus syriacus TaxID=106335 RepID=A0A6A3D1N6_HIBSY|nr:hypothetical protein F3Y22_tig00000340pilonHSYRG01241 [Hibiscus syriacus]
MDDWFTYHVTSRLSSLSSPDDLFNFFNELRETLGGVDSGVMDDGHVILDPNSNLGMFLRRCILAFNLLTFEMYIKLWARIIIEIEHYCWYHHHMGFMLDIELKYKSAVLYPDIDIRDFHIAKREEDIGFYAGFVGHAYEVCRDEYWDLALSVVSTSRGIELIIGSAIGGFIAQPIEKYQNLLSKSSIFGRFPTSYHAS